MTAAAPPPEKASLGDWLAVAAGTLGCLMALMDVSIVNASLPVIQGEIGATPSEGTWVGTAYLVAEIVVIPLTAWLERLLGLRRLLVGGALLFTLFSVLCGLATSLTMIILGRIGQGLCGAVLIPTAMTLVAKRLPPAQQPGGLAMVAASALMGPAIGPVFGGWLTENLSWHFAFFVNVPICAAQVAMLVFAMKPTSGDLGELAGADWFGIAGMILGLGGATTLLEEGHREQWFESALIWKLAAVTVIGFALIAIGQLGARRPVLRLALLRNPRVSSPITMMVAVGLLLYSGLYVIPQFLAAIAGYNALQAGQITFIGGFVAIPSAGLFPLLVHRVDTRLLVAFGIVSSFAGCMLASRLTVLSAGEAFVLPQVLYGIGTTYCALPLQQVVLAAVTSEDTPDANGLIAVARNLGGSVGLAALASFQDQRFDVHSWQIHAGISANEPGVQEALMQSARNFGGGAEGLMAAYRAFDGQVAMQALVMTFNDMFLALAMVAVVVLPLVLMIRPLRPGTPMAAVH
ncbi:MAG: DHA2 family efflux MFS transporter permease subunit [Sphingomonadales bacterium]|nr:DHA2 family efflux MFS transporter permease subunit [Sphingomonadales bacterium]